MNKIKDQKIRIQLTIDKNIYDKIKKYKPANKNNQEFLLDLVKIGLIDEIKN